MCLILDENKKSKIASADIVCYKVLRLEQFVSDDGSIYGELYSPFQHYYYELNKLIEEKSHCKINKRNNVDIIESGVFHTFEKREDAIEYIKSWHSSYSSFTGLGIVKCSIPKGTRYYEGKFWNKSSYGSKKLYVTNDVFGAYDEK